LLFGRDSSFPGWFDLDLCRTSQRLGAARCLRKPFKPATLLTLIDECLSEAEPHRKCVATLSSVVEAVSGPRGKAAVPGVPIEETFMG
jgi:hypothetical protein